jgi:hypothetical protein
MLRKRAGRFGPRILVPVALLILLWGAEARSQARLVEADTCGAPVPALAQLLNERDIPVDLIRAYAEPFISSQDPDGGYRLTPNVQTHMKAVMAMVLATQVTGDTRYAESARRDLLWIVRNRMEPNGGINWNGPQNPYFFEVHQHWFLIASELVRQTLGEPDSLRTLQRRAWLYLLQNNPASADFYYHNLTNHGVFFAYRSLDRDGRFQTQAPFKGSYEVGAALWALALHSGHSWLDVGPGGTPGHTVAEYLGRLVTQAQMSPYQKGFFDQEKGSWIRSLRWNGIDWSGWETHDTKYALHTSEGALLYTILTGRRDLVDEERRDVEALLARIYPTGMVRGIPDGYGSAAYEYGEALSVLGLGAQVPWGPTHGIGNHCLDAGRSVFAYAVNSFGPMVSEDAAVLLLGMCRIFQADQLARTIVKLDDASSDIVSARATLSVWPNPMSDRTTITYSLRSEATGSLRIIDAGGREVTSIAIPATDAAGRFLWDGRDARGRSLPSGQYRALLDDGRTRWSAGISIVR